MTIDEAIAHAKEVAKEKRKEMQCKTCTYYESGNCEYWSGEIKENDTCSHYVLSKNVYEWQYSPLENIAICSKCRYEHYLGTYHQYATNFCPNCGQKMKQIN